MPTFTLYGPGGVATSETAVIGPSGNSWYLGPFADDAAAETAAGGLSGGLLDGMTYLNTGTDKTRVRIDGAWVDYDADAQAAITTAAGSAATAVAAQAGAEAARDEVRDAYSRVATIGRPAGATLITGTGNAADTTFIYRLPTGYPGAIVDLDVYKIDSANRNGYAKRFASDGTIIQDLGAVAFGAGAGEKTVTLAGFGPWAAGEYIALRVGAGTLALIAGAEQDSGGLWAVPGNVTTSFDPLTAPTTTSQLQARFNIIEQVVTGDAFVELDEAVADQDTRLVTTESKVTRILADKRVQRLTNQVAALRSAAPLAFVANDKATSVQTACTAVSAPMTARRLNRLSRFFDRLDAVGITVDNLPALWFQNDLVGDTGTMGLDRTKINLMQPGKYDLVVHGTPTYTAFNGITYASNADYFDTQVPIGALDTTKAGIGLILNPRTGTPINTSTSAYDMGVQYDSTKRLAINCTTTGTAGNYAACGTAVARTTNQSGYLDARHAMSVRRIDSASFGVCKFGRPVGGAAIGVNTNASAAPTSDLEAVKTIFIGKMNTGTAGTKSNNAHYAWYVSNGLTQAQEVELTTALYDLMMSVWWGDMMVYDVGSGPKTVRKDVIIYGTSPMACLAAYAAAKAGLSVAIVGAWSDHTAWDVGMTLTPFADIKTASAAYGLWWQVNKWMFVNVHQQDEPSTPTQYNQSNEPRAWRAMMAGRFDPTRTDSLLPGQDIEVFMTGGIRSVSKRDATLTAIHTMDGRSFYGRMFGEGGYDGDLIRLAGVPYQLGHSAAGSGGESVAGFSTTPKKPLSGSASGDVELNVSGYSADNKLLPDYVNMPTYASGAAFLGLQSFNLRETFVNNDKTRWAPNAETPPAGYDAARYEAVGRFHAAQTAAYAAFPLVKADVVALGNLVTSNSAVQDLNNSNTGAVDLDLGNSGTDYLAAGDDYVARRGVWEDLRLRQTGWWYYMLRSGDSRLQSGVVTALSTYWLDPLQYLDPGPFGELHRPTKIYTREPIYLPKNTGFVATGDDLVQTDGTTPRSVKTISQVNYSRDLHAQYAVVTSDGWIASVGGLGAGQGGTNLITPWPFEASVPDKSVCENLAFLSVASGTRIWWSAARMEVAMCMAAEAMAYAMVLAIENNIAIQDVDYTELRTMIQAAGYDRTPPLPQVN